ncbi:hypothetical protein Q5752_005043 [Cryptotrichosporon argae]
MVVPNAYWAAALALASTSFAAPAQQPMEMSPFDPLKHLAAISPFYLPTREPDTLPTHCELDRVSVLVRHSSILGNDDEYAQTMGPFVDKVARIDRAALPAQGPWAFLREWETPIVENKLEKLSERGRRDAKALGRYLREQYAALFPPKKRGQEDADREDDEEVEPKRSKITDQGKGKGKGKSKKGKGEGKGKDEDQGRPTYKVWTASSARDIESAEAYIKGAFPAHQAGDDGHGDGDVIQLVKVPNKAAEWDRSLTPHKACAAFEKDSSLVPANKWLAVYGPRVRARIATLAPAFAAELDDNDVLAMQMLCGYETIAQGDSPFCSVFTREEWLAFEYHQDVRYHYMLGYGQPLAPYLGMPWAKTAAHLLDGKDSDGDEHPSANAEAGETAGAGLAAHDKLPPPRVPPNATHTQRLHVSFTHRESPGFVAVFLNLYNASDAAVPATRAPPLDRVVPGRAWRSSHLIPFLGHVALERFTCPGAHGRHGARDDYVRAVVNGKHEVMGGCEDGVDGSCRWDTFADWVEARAQRWGAWESVCTIDDDVLA